MVLEQYYLGCLAHASYLIADEQHGEAAVVDPQRDVEQYIEDARRLGCRIAHVFLTHFHADFIAGHGDQAVEVFLLEEALELARAVGVRSLADNQWPWVLLQLRRGE